MQFHLSRTGSPVASPRIAEIAGGSVHTQDPGMDPVIAPRRIGKYLVSPLIKGLENGWYASSVSIRSGSGSATTDRVLRLARLFRSRTEAASFAHAEGLQWISASARPSAA